MRLAILTSIAAGQFFLQGALASQIQYKVVVNPPKGTHSVGVALGSEVYPLEANEQVPLLYEGQAPSGLPYRYVMLSDNKTMVDFEPFDRPAIQHAHGTFNEFYGRPWNKLELEALPQLYSVSDNKNAGRSKLFEDGTIATLHIQVNAADMITMHTQKMDKKIKVTGNITYINYDNIQQVNDVVIKVGGHSTRNWAKIPYKLKVPETAEEGLHHRWELKLRPESTDPTMMREKLYQDMLQASGILGPHGSYVRLYMNHVPVGLYLLVDNSASETFIRETMYNGNADAELGSLILGDAGKGEYAANMAYRGDNVALYDDKVYRVKMSGEGDDDVAMVDFIQFTKFINAYNPDAAPNSALAADAWKDKIDLQRFLRQQALEWIGGNWDGVQYSGNNYAIYRQPGTSQYLLIPTDFDYTFGNGIEEDQRYILTGNWQDFTGKRLIHSFLWEKISKTPYLATMYEDTLKDLNNRLSHPDVMFKRIDSLTYFLKNDIAWDLSLERMTVGLTRNWTAADFLTSMDSNLGNTDLLYGLKEWVRIKHDSIKNQLETV